MAAAAQLARESKVWLAAHAQAAAAVKMAARNGFRVIYRCTYADEEALMAGPKWGAVLMDIGHQLGQVREGSLADLLLVRDDLVAHIARLRDADNLLAILQNRRFHKTPASHPAHAT